MLERPVAGRWTRWTRVLGMLAVVVSAVFLDAMQRPPLPRAVLAASPQAPLVSGPAQWQVTQQGEVPMPPGMAAAHASTLVAMPPGHPAAVTVLWFSGDRESAPNVQIAASQWDRALQRWLPARMVMDRHQLGSVLHFGVRRLGNPVAWLDAQGQLHVYVVATGAGGWAASRILHVRQSSASNQLEQLELAPERVLPLSWLWNTSYLVRNAPLRLADGGAVLPVHFELGIKVPAAVRLDGDGRFMGMTRMSQRNFLLQPALVAVTPTHWQAYLRDESTNARIGVVETRDAGKHWSDLPDLPLVNPDSAVAALATGSGDLVMAHNASPGSRNWLDMSASHDGRTWETVLRLAQGQGEDEFSYPALLVQDDELWVTYTVDRHRIAWQRLRKSGSAP